MKKSKETPKEEPQKREKKSLKTTLWIVGAVVLVIIGLCIWFFGPMRKVLHTELLPPSAFAFFSIDLDPESSGFAR